MISDRQEPIGWEKSIYTVYINLNICIYRDVYTHLNIHTECISSRANTIVSVRSMHTMTTFPYMWIKGLVTVGWELRQQHPSDLLSGVGTSPPDNKSRGCCWRYSRPTVINPDYNMTKQLCMKRIYNKIRSKSPPNRAPSPSCLHCDVTHLSLTTGIVALHIPSWRVREREERRQARKALWPVNAGRVIYRYWIFFIWNHQSP